MTLNTVANGGYRRGPPLRGLLRAAASDGGGAAAVEYAALCALLSVLLIAALRVTGYRLSAVFGVLAGWLPSP